MAVGELAVGADGFEVCRVHFGVGRVLGRGIGGRHDCRRFSIYSNYLVQNVE
jgi:hypothetical protein